MIRLIASDMDGTLLNNDHDIDIETVEAIRKAEEAGIIFAISTGREYDSVKVLLDKHNIKAQCVLSNGAEYRDEDGNILDVINIKEESAKKIIEILDKNKMSARIFTEKGVFTTSTREMALQEIIFRTMSFNPSLTEEEAREVAENLGFFTCLQFIDDLDKFFEEGVEVRKFVAFHSDIELIDKMKKVLGEIEGLAISSSFRDNIEITDINAQKGIILEKVATKMDIAREDVMILGDSFNDYSMFEIFEETVAMKNAIPEVKAIAKYITDSNDNLGVAKAIYNVINNEMDKMLKEK
ncbi:MULTISPECIES: Cof-type HAD-IIB family hydrolase [Clostridium]|jgi:Cof subfamily protein (haloacid dehalogenase superfamily)|uniref:Cof-type HAD-IIB family hydrolase n=1 Tax=Clostridium tertium TaxID=1559 RepID=A0A9X3XIW7_9CLOT|nr:MULTISPECIES: Cof-type HAD-IIB family hydrolase [Clostridium]EEH98665.1 cof-like hydrolase [Clostridium sp. 7_2_43FAA]MBP1868626.1 Cof subfamily protein (haloacid dehalogenase superfamily) [Clostridium tertium]MDB1942242.1 Cof-type HAD-IIB family hydrolase [Clostridium tertium]MDB1946768.1 Cof-type HAD-IIB family hydrolase [Clostridium tertium]MDB1954525.1 Cof-type HAD-IIB family hydrolase [Clostridium tertium]